MQPDKEKKPTIYDKLVPWNNGNKNNEVVVCVAKSRCGRSKFTFNKFEEEEENNEK